MILGAWITLVATLLTVTVVTLGVALLPGRPRRVTRQLPWAPTVDEGDLTGTVDPIQRMQRRAHAVTMAIFEGWNRRVGSREARRSLRESVDMRGEIAELDRAIDDVAETLRPLTPRLEAIRAAKEAAERVYAYERVGRPTLAEGPTARPVSRVQWTRVDAAVDALRDALAALSRDSRAPGLLVEQPARFETTRISQDTHQLVARVADGTGHRSQELEWAMGDWAREDSLHKAIEALEEHLEELETTIWDGLFAEIRDTATATTLAELGTSPESTTGGVRAIGFLVERCQTILDEAGAIELRLRDLKTRSRDLEERLSGRGTDQGLLRAGGSLYRAALPHSGLEVPTLPLDVRDTVLRRWLFAGLVGLVAGAVVLNVLGYLLVLQAPG